MQKRKGEIDGFWLFLIGVMVVLPAIKHVTGYHKEFKARDSKPKVVNVKGNILEIDGNSATSIINTNIKIPIKTNVLIVKKTFIKSGESETITTNGKYVNTSFDKTGAWDIDMYDVNHSLVEWVKVTVY